MFKFIVCRKRRAQRRSPASIPVTILDLDEDQPKSTSKEGESTSIDETAIAEVEKPSKADEEVDAKSSGVSSSTPSIPCLDRLREELSCAVRKR